ncbi:VWD domain-containing protein, partial [Salmonella sp. s51944]|uniref:VWD domain-containing protein n=1 Tax=Salmonella sp. s51944 TaxID=3159655 RepID=UPI003980C8D6
GYGFTFQGDLEYLAVQTCNNEDGRIPEFQVVTDNYRRIESMPVTYIRELRLEYNDVAYALTHPDKVSVDGVEVTLPYVDRNNGITIYYAAPYK